MSLQEFIDKYDGEFVDYDGVYGAQCVDLVAYYTKEVQGVILPPHPSARDYWINGIPGYDRVTSPQPGDIVVYDGHGNYTDGHIAIVVNGMQVFEQNADPDHSPSHVATRANTYLMGYLRKQGIDMSDIADHDFVADVSVLATNLQPEVNQNFLNNIGLPKDQVVKNFLNYSEHTDLLLRAGAYDDLVKENNALKAELGKTAKVDPNSIVVTAKGWQALFNAIKTFFNKNN